MESKKWYKRFGIWLGGLFGFAREVVDVADEVVDKIKPAAKAYSELSGDPRPGIAAEALDRATDELKSEDGLSNVERIAQAIITQSMDNDELQKLIDLLTKRLKK